MDPDRARPKLPAVPDQVIVLAESGAGVAVDQLFVTFDRARERMMDERPSARFLVLEEQREIDDPEKLVPRLVDELELLAQVDPLAAALNPSTATEDPHMLVSAYVVTGFVVAAVYAAGLWRGRNDIFHRRGLAAGMVMAAVAIVLAGITGDSSARFIYEAQPAKFAAMEGIYQTERGAPITLGGIPSDAQQRVLFGIEIPKALSFLASFDPNAEVRGLNSFPPGDRPNPVLVHLSFDGMVGLGTFIGLVAAVFWFLAARRRSVPTGRLLLLGLIAAGPASVIAMEAGWFVTEFGRQPWIVYGVMRTSEAATSAPALGPTFALFIAIYAGLAITTGRLLLLLAARTRNATT